MKKLLLVIPLLFFLWLCGEKVIAHVISIAIDILIGYYVLFLLCNRIMERKKFNNIDDILKEYEVKGVARIILTSFQDFEDKLNLVGKIIKKIFNFFSENLKNNCNKHCTDPEDKTCKQ